MDEEWQSPCSEFATADNRPRSANGWHCQWQQRLRADVRGDHSYVSRCHVSFRLPTQSVLLVKKSDWTKLLDSNCRPSPSKACIDALRWAWQEMLICGCEWRSNILRFTQTYAGPLRPLQVRPRPHPPLPRDQQMDNYSWYNLREISY